jgi:hypothetical protein
LPLWQVVYYLLLEIYWQDVLTQPNLWAGLTQLTAFPPHLAFRVGKLVLLATYPDLT